MTKERKWCWPFGHEWGIWKDHSEYMKKVPNTEIVVEIGLVQERRCERCNIAQRRQVNK